MISISDMSDFLVGKVPEEVAKQMPKDASLSQGTIRKIKDYQFKGKNRDFNSKTMLKMDEYIQNFNKN